jgi:hypothetical protein
LPQNAFYDSSSSSSAVADDDVADTTTSHGFRSFAPVYTKLFSL